jgi:hypothetical protein
MIQKYNRRSYDPDEVMGAHPYSAHNIKTRLYAMVSYKLTFNDVIDGETFQKSFLTEGYNFFIHNPYDVLTTIAKFTTSKVNYSIQHYVIPSQTQIDESLKTYDPKR